VARQRFRYATAVGDDAVRALEPGLTDAQAIALECAEPGDRAFLSVEPATLRLSH
jgi:hypothetical protein